MNPIVVLPGYLLRDRLGAILDASSSVTLLKTEDKGNVLIDTGERSRRDKLLDGLKKNKLQPKDIDILINTHSHPDHTGSNELFDFAVWMVHKDEYLVKSKKAKKFIEVGEGFEIAAIPTTYVIETPGHTRGSITVIVETDEVYAITGDSLPLKDNYLEWVPPGINYNPEIAIASMERIVKFADWIIPGHDGMFRID